MSSLNLKSSESATGSLATVGSLDYYIAVNQILSDPNPNNRQTQQSFQVLNNERVEISSGRKNVKETYEAFANVTSAHGFQYTVGGSKGQRVFGIFVIVVFCAIASVFTFQAINDFFTGPGFSSEYKLVYTRRSDPQPLDVFAICDIAPWDFDKAEAANISVQMISYLAYSIFVFDAEKEQKDQTT